MKTKFWLCCFFILLITFEANAAILFQDDFDGYTDSPSNHGWAIGSAVTAVDGEGYNGSRGVKVSYTTAGTGPYWFGWAGIGSYNRPAIYVRFYFKTANNNGGMKFCKLFGKQDGAGYANATVPLEGGSSNVIYAVRYGMGYKDNDTQTKNALKGPPNYTDEKVVFQAYSESFTPDNQWHCFEFYMKYNTDNNRDGEYKVWIDGELRLHTTNVLNRNNTNTRAFRSIDFANYTATNTTHVRPIWYDNVVISDDYIGPDGDIPPSLDVPDVVQGFKKESAF